MPFCCGVDVYFAHMDEHLRLPKHAVGIPCSTCGACFDTKAKLDQHDRSGFHLDPPLPIRPVPPAGRNSGAERPPVQRTPLFRCGPCNRDFMSQLAFENHLNSSVHSFPCPSCSEIFPDQFSLTQHGLYRHRGKPVTQPVAVPTVPRNHTAKRAPHFHCAPCDREFTNQAALDQHLQDAAIHNPLFRCAPCDRNFGDQSAMDRHLLDSPAHKPCFRCVPCDREYSDQNALDQHLLDSPLHKTFRCQTCGAKYIEKALLSEHQRSAHRSTPVAQVPHRQPVQQVQRQPVQQVQRQPVQQVQRQPVQQVQRQPVQQVQRQPVQQVQRQPPAPRKPAHQAPKPSQAPRRQPVQHAPKPNPPATRHLPVRAQHLPVPHAPARAPSPRPGGSSALEKYSGPPARAVFTCDECPRTFQAKDLLTLHAAEHVQRRLGL